MTSPLNIFYSDDDPDDLEMFELAAQSVQNILIYTYNGAEKLLEAMKNPPPVPNVIFLDLNMPGKNGFDIVKELRGSSNHKDTPIIIYSTSSAVHDINRCRQLGANYFAVKPSSLRELASLINHVASIKWESFFPDMREFVYRA